LLISEEAATLISELQVLTLEWNIYSGSICLTETTVGSRGRIPPKAFLHVHLPYRLKPALKFWGSRLEARQFWEAVPWWPWAPKGDTKRELLALVVTEPRCWSLKS
jgi:hypothetical protein